jgi:hypothetical protein
MSSIDSSVIDTSLMKTKVFTANLAQAAATYDLATCNAVGGVVIQDIQIYVATAGATFTSVSIQTNDTTAVTMLSAAEGALANLTVGKNVVRAFASPTYLHTSKKIQYTIVGLTGTGSLLIIVRYQPTVSGADIS